MKLLLTRDYLGSDCTQGLLTCDGGHWETIERPWIPVPNAPCGKKGLSCIPVGIYTLEKHNSKTYPHSFALVNRDLWVYHFDGDVPVDRRGVARTLVLIHASNLARELRGCIAPGRGRAIDKAGVRSVIKSRLAMADIMALVPWTSKETHMLEIAEQ